MITDSIEAFAGRNVLLLQGPVGPFFARFARDLERVGARVSKINFNGGDCLFHPAGLVYRGTMEAWPDWLAALLTERSIDVMFLFGDCRPVHRAAHAVATRLGVEVGVFEEGYLRPDFITLERHGVNGHSRHRRDPAACRAAPARDVPVRPVPRSFWPMVLWGFLYFAVGALTRRLFPHYRHHRAMTVAEAWPWLRSPWRKAWYALAERGMTRRMTGAWSGRFFLAPLQVHNDAQVNCHAEVGGVPGFIAHVIASFARHAPGDALLVIKHHPMDRGYRDYAAAIRRAARAAGAGARVHYIHDQHMPTILPHCRGVVVINSTVGLAAVGCGRPTKTLGAAIYDMPGLTFQGPIARFWRDAAEQAPDPALYAAFRSHLIAETQINGNFYLRLDRQASATGLLWRRGALPEPASEPVPHRPRIVSWPVPAYAITGSSTAALPARQPQQATI
jgi:capsular polysaccharide export protein